FALGEWMPPSDHNPIFAVLWLLLGMVGLPFFVVATSAPLLQKWFAATGHQAAKDPYFLYGASNLGSMLALLLYPVLVEPFLDLDSQRVVWTIGYALLVALVAGCGYLVWRAPAGQLIFEGPARAESVPMPAEQGIKPAPAASAGQSTAIQKDPSGGWRPK